MSDDKGQDDKVLCVPHGDPMWSGMRDLEDVPSQLRTEIEHFFAIYKQLEGKEVAVEGWRPREEALRVIEESRERYAAGAS
jgi:inorganic pyrophosphatase